MIHIACCSNEKLAPMFGVVVTSVGINVTSDDVMMYLLHNGLKRSTVKRLQKIADRYNVRLKFLEIDLEILKYTLIPQIKKKAWENKTYIEGGGVVSNNYQ